MGDRLRGAGHPRSDLGDALGGRCVVAGRGAGARRHSAVVGTGRRHAWRPGARPPPRTRPGHRDGRGRHELRHRDDRRRRGRGYADTPVFAKYPVALPIIDITSIGAGGGSIAWIEPETGVLKVGPQSAGASPGPACLRRGWNGADRHRRQCRARGARSRQLSWRPDAPQSRARGDRRPQGRGRAAGAGSAGGCRANRRDRQLSDGGPDPARHHRAGPRPRRLHGLRLRWRGRNARRGRTRESSAAVTWSSRGRPPCSRPLGSG